MGVGGAGLATLLALRPSGKIDVATRRAPPIRCVLLRNVGSRRIGSARGIALLAFLTASEIDVVALQTLPVRRILGPCERM